MSNFISLLTIDVEDWFQVENLRDVIARDSWDCCELRVVENTYCLLELLERHRIKATFFVLGYIAERAPKLIKEIHSLGHEIASHGYAHELITNQRRWEFAEDVDKSKKILEDITGEKILGYRAPSFSITEWAIDILKEKGYVYDSSFCPTPLHRRYGKLDMKTTNSSPIFKFSNGLIEVRLPVLNVMGVSIPFCGGAYFRILPYRAFKLIITKYFNNKIWVFYIHPWEIDPGQPKVKNIKLNYRIRHYTGLKNCLKKFERLLKDFCFTSIRSFLEKQVF